MNVVAAPVVSVGPAPGTSGVGLGNPADDVASGEHPFDRVLASASAETERARAAGGGTARTGTVGPRVRAETPARSDDDLDAGSGDVDETEPEVEASTLLSMAGAMVAAAPAPPTGQSIDAAATLGAEAPDGAGTLGGDALFGAAVAIPQGGSGSGAAGTVTDGDVAAVAGPAGDAMNLDAAASSALAVEPFPQRDDAAAADASAMVPPGVSDAATSGANATGSDPVSGESVAVAAVATAPRPPSPGGEIDAAADTDVPADTGTPASALSSVLVATPAARPGESGAATAGDGAETAARTIAGVGSSGVPAASAAPASAAPAASVAPAPVAASAPVTVSAAAQNTAAVLEPWQQVLSVMHPLRRFADGSHRLSISLQPEELGAVTVEFSLHRGTLDLHLVTERASAAEALRSALPALRAELEGSGARTGAFDVGGQWQAPDRGSRPSPTPSTSDAAHVAADAETTAGPVGAIQTGTGRLDLRI